MKTTLGAIILFIGLFILLSAMPTLILELIHATSI